MNQIERSLPKRLLFGEIPLPRNPWNYLLESGPLVVQASPPSWEFYEPMYISVLAGIIVRGCVRPQWTLFLKTQHICPFYGWFISAHTYTELSVQQFLTKKWHDPHAPASLFARSHLEQLFFCFPWWRTPQRETFCRCGRGETRKTAEALKGTKIDKFKNCFEQWKKCLNSCTASNEEYFEGDWSLNIQQ